MGLAVYEAVQCRSYVVHGSPHGCLAFKLNVTVSFSSGGVSLSRTFWLVVPRTPFLLSVVPTCMGNPLWLGNTLEVRHGSFG